MKTTIDLNLFKHNLLDDLKEFETFYKQNQKKSIEESNGENWPDQMGEGDWYEQFLCYLNSK
jgi:hypothetical protein